MYTSDTHTYIHVHVYQNYLIRGITSLHVIIQSARWHVSCRGDVMVAGATNRDKAKRSHIVLMEQALLDVLAYMRQGFI